MEIFGRLLQVHPNFENLQEKSPNLFNQEEKNNIMEIAFTTQVWKEGNIYISYAEELEVCSCGKTVKEAKKNLIEAVECFLETAEEMGTLDQLLEEAGFLKGKRIWKTPEIISTERTSIAFPK